MNSQEFITRMKNILNDLKNIESQIKDTEFPANLALDIAFDTKETANNILLFISKDIRTDEDSNEHEHTRW